MECLIVSPPDHNTYTTETSPCLLGNLRKDLLYEPRHEKTCLRGLRPGKTQMAYAATETS